jgi:hypothetical protein
MSRQFKVTVEKHSDRYVDYPMGLKGAVVGEGRATQKLFARRALTA